MDLDHPKDRYPPGSLVSLDKVITFHDGQSERKFPIGSLMLILGYSHEYSTGARGQREKWNIVGLVNGSRVVSLQRFIGGELMKYLTMQSDIRNVEEGVEE